MIKWLKIQNKWLIVYPLQLVRGKNKLFYSPFYFIIILKMTKKQFITKLKKFCDKTTTPVYEDNGFYFMYDGYGYFVKIEEKDNFFILFSHFKRKTDNKDFYDFIQGGTDINYMFEFLENYEGKTR